MKSEALVVVFAKAPVPGKVKTRLIPVRGAEGAARLHMRLVENALRTARAARIGPVELHGSARHSRLHGPHFRLQRGADLGERMHRAIAQGLKRHRAVVLIGADCPVLEPRDLRRAARLLRCGYDAVFAPAEDGGYALVAMRRASRKVFEGVAWGSGQVWRDTLERLAGLGYRWRALQTVWDVDRPDDLARLQCYTRRRSREEAT